MNVIDRSVLEEALLLYLEEQIDALPHVDGTFSEKHERRMQKLFARSEKPYYRFIRTRARRAAIIIVAVFISLSVTVTSVSALREGFVDFVVAVYEKFSHVFVSDSGKDEPFPIVIETKYAPTDIPDAYELTETTDLPMMYQLKYTETATGTLLYFKQAIIASSHHTLDTEGISAEKVMIGEIEALYYTNKDMGNILWLHQGYSFRITGPDSVDLLKIAASVVQE